VFFLQEKLIKHPANANNNARFFIRFDLMLVSYIYQNNIFLCWFTLIIIIYNQR
jgi:hypothetical protein